MDSKKAFGEGYDAAKICWDPKNPDDLTFEIINPYVYDKELRASWQAGWNWYVTLETPATLHIDI